MSVQIYINYNGFLYEENEPIFTVKNRGFRYGDALFETIRIIDGKPCFLTDHFNRLKKGMGMLKMRSADISFENIEKQINKLIEKNHIKKGGRIRLSVFRSGDGLYTPENESKSYVIEARPIKENQFELNKNGLTIDIFNEHRRHINLLSQIKTTNNIPHVLAGIFVKDSGLDDCIIINEHGRIVEASNSNIFIYKNNSIYTPSIEEGCMDGVMRKQLIKIAKGLNINVFEGMVNGSMLLQADEMFLTNAIKGIQWVSAYRQKRFYNKYTKTILEHLNQSVPI